MLKSPKFILIIRKALIHLQKKAKIKHSQSIKSPFKGLNYNQEAGTHEVRPISMLIKVI